MIKEGNMGKKGGGKEEWNGKREKRRSVTGGRIDEETKKAGKNEREIMNNERRVIKEEKRGKGKRDKREWDGEGKQAAGRMEEGGSNEGKRD